MKLTFLVILSLFSFSAIAKLHIVELQHCTGSKIKRCAYTFSKTWSAGYSEVIIATNPKLSPAESEELFNDLMKRYGNRPLHTGGSETRSNSLPFLVDGEIVIKGGSWPGRREYWLIINKIVEN